MKKLNTTSTFKLDTGYTDQMVSDLRISGLYKTVKSIKRSVSPSFTTNDVYVTLTPAGVNYFTNECLDHGMELAK